MAQMTSTGNGPLKSLTRSKPSRPSRSSRIEPITVSTTGPQSAMRRGVNARLTSLRIRSCIGGSIMIIEFIKPVISPNSGLVSWSMVSPWVEVNAATSRCTSTQSA